MKVAQRVASQPSAEPPLPFRFCADFIAAMNGPRCSADLVERRMA